jgi:hypothetical protein
MRDKPKEFFSYKATFFPYRRKERWKNEKIRKQCEFSDALGTWDLRGVYWELFTDVSAQSVSFHLQGSSSIGPIGCPQTSVNHYQSTLRNIPEERRSLLYCSGNLKVFILGTAFYDKADRTENAVFLSDAESRSGDGVWYCVLPHFQT